MAILLSFAALAFVAGSTWQGTREYRVFRALSDTRARQRYYWRWTAWGRGVTGLLGLVALGVLGRLHALDGLPVEFTELSLGDSAVPLEGEDPSFWFGAAFGVALALVVPIVVWRKRFASMRTPVVGDIEPLLPRNRAELLACIPLSLSAGIGEELFFRLAFPLVVTLATGSAIVGFIVATVAFALSHLYQGWKGVLATGGLGAVFAFLYLSSGSILRPILAHAVLDLLALVVRPVISARFSRATHSARTPRTQEPLV